MSPSAKSLTDVLKYVCKLMRQYAGRIGRSLVEARASAAINALKKIIQDNSYLKKDELSQEYLGRSKDHKDARVLEPSKLYMKYAEALTLMTEVKVCVLLKALKKNKNKAMCEKFLAMSNEGRSKWLETL